MYNGENDNFLSSNKWISLFVVLPVLSFCYGLVGCLAYTVGPLDSYRPIYSSKSKEQSRLFKQKYNTVASTSKQKKQSVITTKKSNTAITRPTKEKKHPASLPATQPLGSLTVRVRSAH